MVIFVWKWKTKQRKQLKIIFHSMQLSIFTHRLVSGGDKILSNQFIVICHFSVKSFLQCSHVYYSISWLFNFQGCILTVTHLNDIHAILSTLSIIIVNESKNKMWAEICEGLLILLTNAYMFIYFEIQTHQTIELSLCFS